MYPGQPAFKENSNSQPQQNNASTPQNVTRYGQQWAQQSTNSQTTPEHQVFQYAATYGAQAGQLGGSLHQPTPSQQPQQYHAYGQSQGQSPSTPNAGAAPALVPTSTPGSSAPHNLSSSAYTGYQSYGVSQAQQHQTPAISSQEPQYPQHQTLQQTHYSAQGATGHHGYQQLDHAAAPLGQPAPQQYAFNMTQSSGIVPSTGATNNAPWLWDKVEEALPSVNPAPGTQTTHIQTNPASSPAPTTQTSIHSATTAPTGTNPAAPAATPTPYPASAGQWQSVPAQLTATTWPQSQHQQEPVSASHSHHQNLPENNVASPPSTSQIYQPQPLATAATTWVQPPASTPAASSALYEMPADSNQTQTQQTAQGFPTSPYAMPLATPQLSANHSNNQHLAENAQQQLPPQQQTQPSQQLAQYPSQKPHSTNSNLYQVASNSQPYGAHNIAVPTYQQPPSQQQPQAQQTQPLYTPSPHQQLSPSAIPLPNMISQPAATQSPLAQQQGASGTHHTLTTGAQVTSPHIASQGISNASQSPTGFPTVTTSSSNIIDVPIQQPAALIPQQSVPQSAPATAAWSPPVQTPNPTQHSSIFQSTNTFQQPQQQQQQQTQCASPQAAGVVQPLPLDTISTVSQEPGEHIVGNDDQIQPMALVPVTEGELQSHDPVPEATQIQIIQLPPGALSLRKKLARRALIIGINYETNPEISTLRGCVNDAKMMALFLVKVYGYDPSDILLLTDDNPENVDRLPTTKNIWNGMKWLVHDAQPGDRFAFHFSGHGSQVEDYDGDEDDGFDEVIIPLDCVRGKLETVIIDDEMHDLMVKPLPKGAKLTAIFDSCHSGSALDLPYTYSTQGSLKEPNMAKEAGKGFLKAVAHSRRGNFIGAGMSLVQSAKKIATQDKTYMRAMINKTSQADVVSWSGSKDAQYS